MDLTIAIPTYRRDRPLLLTLQQLRDVKRGNEEILVLDQNSYLPDDIENCLCRWEQQKVLRRIHQQHASLTGARNVALREARGDVILFLDDDLFISRKSIDRHLEAHTGQKHCSAVTGQVYQCQLAMKYPPEWDVLKASSEKHFLASTLQTTDTVIGCNHSVKREDILQIGGYDEAFIGAAHAEDFDIGHRLTLAGKAVYYDPEAWVVHFKVPSGGCRVGSPFKLNEWTNTANLFLYTFRHGFRKKNFRKYFFLALRAGPLRKGVIYKPWIWPWAWVSCAYGCAYGLKNRTFRRVSAR